VSVAIDELPAAEAEHVTLLNTTAAAIDLGGWQLVDRDGHAMALEGFVAAGETLRVELTRKVTLPNGGGGVISLLAASGLKVDGVAYTGDQAAEPGRTIIF